jgi:hypothetical protein
VLRYLASEAGQTIMSIHSDPHSLAPWTGMGLLSAKVAATIAIAAILLRRRDV